MTPNIEEKQKKKGASVYIGGLIVLAVAICMMLLLSSLRKSSIEAETKTRGEAAAAGPFVRVANVAISPAQQSLILEGDARPYASVTLYAKISGYLKKISVDKGDNVKEGQVLAVLESPETDKQYLGAMADYKNKKNIADRNRALLKKDLISPESADQSDADEEVSKENLAMLEQEKSYEILCAPFSGTVTARYADPGALMQSAANSQSSSLPVVALSRIDRLRIDFYLDQVYAPYVHVGDSVELTLPERPGFKVNATVSRFSKQLDQTTRMLLVEIEAPNPNQQIVPWSTVQVKLRVARPRVMLVPQSALVIRGTKYFVPVVGADKRIAFREVHVGENHGDNVEVIDGLQGSESIALNLGETITEGTKIQPIAQPANPSPTAGPAPTQPGASSPPPSSAAPQGSQK